MNVIKLNGEKYTYPKNWDGLTVSTFDKIQTNLSAQGETSGVKKMVSIYSIITGIPKNVFITSPIEFYNQVAKTLEWLETPPDNPPALTQTIKGVKYVFPLTLNSITLGEWADLDEVLKMDGKVNAGILAVLFRPEGEVYSSENFYNRVEFWGRQSCGDVLPVINFFSQIETDLLNPTQTFLTTGAAVISELTKARNLVKNGVGLRRRLTLREAIYLKLISYYKKTLLRYLIFFRTYPIKKR
jgi:hypothetical protein